VTGLPDWEQQKANGAMKLWNKAPLQTIIKNLFLPYLTLKLGWMWGNS
jgi:hypothetical protein